MVTIRSFLYLAFLTITVIPYAIVCVLWSPLPLRIRYRLTVGWAQLAIWGARYITGIRWQVIGAENLPKQAAVLLSKHQSAWETLFLPAWLLPRQICYVYKRELNRVPFFGWGLALLRMIPINRAKGHDSLEQILRVGKQRLEEGRWPLLFPEGTRIAPGKVGRYRIGGARLAVHAGVAVIPIAHNAGELWPRRAFLKKPGLITVSIGPPINTQGLKAAEVNQKVQNWIEGEMQRLNPERYQ